MSKKVKVLIAWVVVLIVLIIFDLQISLTLVNPESAFGIFFEIYGEFVMAIVGCISAAMLIRFGKMGINLKKIGLAVLFVLFALMGSTLVALQTNMGPLLTIVLLLAISGFSIFIAMIVPEDRKEIAQKVGVVGVIVGFMPIMVVNLLKFIWGRQRLRSMSNPLTQFTPWYLLQPFAAGNEFMSFPSGHAANSATVIWFSLLPLLFTKLKPYTTHITVAAVIWTVLVMISRVVVGAHFSTDVLIGATVTFIIFYAFKARMEKQLN